MLYRRLDSLQNEFINIQKTALTELAKSKLAIGSNEELANEFKRLEPLLTHTFSEYQPGVLRSESLNKDFEAIFVTVSSIYKFLNHLYRKRRAQTALLGSDLAILKQGVYKLLEDLSIYRFLKLNEEWNDMRLLTFGDGRNASPSPLKALVDSKSNTLTSSVASRTSIIGRTGMLKPTASVTFVTDVEGTGYTRSSHTPQNAIDPDPTSFWAEVLLAERQVSTEYASVLYDGFIVQLVLDLKQTELLNTIDVLPFAMHPIQLLNLEYSTDGTTYTVVPGFAIPTPGLSWATFRCQPIVASYIRVTLLQKNFKALTLNTPKSTVVNNQLFNLIADEELRINFGEREDGEVETRSAEFSHDYSNMLDGLGKLQKTVFDSAPASSMLLPLERLSYNISPILKDEKLAGVRLNPHEEASDFIQLYRVEYLLGLSHLEVSLVDYHPESTFVSPMYVPNGTLQEVAISPTESASTIEDELGDSFQTSCVEYDIEIAPFKTVPLVAYEATSVWEVVKVSASTRTGTTRFDTTDTTPAVYRNGTRLNQNTDYTFTNNGTLYIETQAWVLGAIYAVSYVPTAGQDVLDVRSVFNSSQVKTPENFTSTDSSGKIVLSAPPYINYDVIYNTEYFYKPSAEAKYYYRRDADQNEIDGVVYGTFENTAGASIGLADPSITLSSVSGLYNPTGNTTPGQITIDTETILYTGISSNTLTGCTRAAKGTKASTHADGASVYSTGKMFYEPLTLFVNGIRARNITDYDKGEHPAFSVNTSATRVYHYLQAGPYIYLSTPLSNTSIDVTYNTLAQYAKLNAKIMQTGRLGGGYTSEVSQIQLLMKTADI